MSRLEDLVRETLASREPEVPSGVTLLHDVKERTDRRRRVRWLAAGVAAAVVLACAVTLVMVVPGGREHGPLSVSVSSPSMTTTVALPSDGWKPGDDSLLALTGGPFHAARVNGVVCGWLGTTFRPMLWPAGYQARLDPVELIAPDGTVIAHEGQELTAGGGGDNAKPGTPCARTGQWTFFINGAPLPGDSGVVHGKLEAVGGPPPGPPRPLPGHVTVTGPGPTRTTKVGPDGGYLFSLPPGKYSITGHSPRYGNNKSICNPMGQTVTITNKRRSLTVNVLCQE